MKDFINEKIIQSIEENGYAFAGYWNPTGMELCLVDREEIERLMALELMLKVMVDPVGAYKDLGGKL